MATLLQAALPKALTNNSTKTLNGGHADTSSTTDVAASHAPYVKACEPIQVNNSTACLSSSICIKENSCESISIEISEEQQRILHAGTCSFGDVLSEVPWMKFRLIAEPNMDVFASDIRLRTFIRQVTELTVSIVTKQCTEEIAILVAALVASLTSSMEVRIKLIVETIIKQIATLCLEDTMTACQNLNEIKEKVCFPKHCESKKCDTHCDTGKPCQPTNGDCDSDKLKHVAYDSYSGHSDKSKPPHGSSESNKLGDPGKPVTPNGKRSGKLTPVPGTKPTS
jgi:hypothetical protein